MLLFDFWKYFQRFGFGTASRILASFFFSSRTANISLPKVAYPIGLRTATSDLTVFRQVFLDGCYDFQLDIEPKLIIDGGANIGLTSILFANRYPRAQIIAVEPERSNYQLLRRNTLHYANIKCVNAGIWNNSCQLRIKNPTVGKWAFEVEESTAHSPRSFRAVTIGELLGDTSLSEIDILKIDIEVSEREVFSSGYEEWLPNVKVLMIELHDDLRAGCSEAVNSAVESYNFERLSRANVLLFRRR